MTTRIDTGTRRSSDSPSILVEVQGKSLKLGGSVELLRNAPFTTCSRPGGNPDADEVILGFNSDQSRSLVDINLGPVRSPSSLSQTLLPLQFVDTALAAACTFAAHAVVEDRWLHHDIEPHRCPCFC